MRVDAVMNDKIEEMGLEEPSSFRFEKPLKRALLICSILLLGELLWLFVITPCIPLADVDIQGSGDVSRSVILHTAGITDRTSYMSLDVKNMENALAAIPLFESAKVIKHFPDSIQIVLKERTAVAVSLATMNGRTVPLFFDHNGVIFKIGNEGGGSIPDSIPIVSGFVFENVKPGTKLPAFLRPFFDDLETIRQKAPELLSVISEIHVSKKAYDGFDLVLYPVYNDIKIKLGADLKEETLRYMLLLLDVLNEKGLHTDEIDFRTGTAAYTVRG